MDDFVVAVNRFRGAFDALFNVLGNYPPDLRERSGACGAWSPRQVLAHMSGWLNEAHKRYSQFDHGVEGSAHYDIDAFNAQSIAARSDLSWNTTVAELRGLVQDIAARAESIPPEKAAADPRYQEWLDALGRDCNEHLTQLLIFARSEV